MKIRDLAKLAFVITGIYAVINSIQRKVGQMLNYASAQNVRNLFQTSCSKCQVDAFLWLKR